MQHMSYYCDDCKTHVNASSCPVVVYLVAGHVARGGGEIDDTSLHPGIRALLSQPVARREWCAECAPRGLAALLAEGGGSEVSSEVSAIAETPPGT